MLNKILDLFKPQPKLPCEFYFTKRYCTRPALSGDTFCQVHRNICGIVDELEQRERFIQYRKRVEEMEV